MPEPIIIPVIYTEDTSGLEKALAATGKLDKATQDLKDMQQKAFTEGAADAKNMANALQDTAAEMADLETATKDTAKSGSTFKSIITENLRGLSLFGRNLGDVVDGLKAKQVALRGVVSGLGGASGALRVFKVALAATGIGAVLLALTGLVALFTKTQAGANKVSQALAGIGAAVDVIIARAAKLGEGVLKIFSGDFSGAAEDAKAAFAGIGDEILKAASAAAELEAATQRLGDAERELAILASARRAEIEKNKEIADDEENSFRRRIAASKSAAETERDIREQEIKLAEEALRIIREQNKLKGEVITGADQDAEAEAIIRVNNLKADGSKQERIDLNKTQALLRQQQREIQRLAEEERKREQQRLKIEAANRATFNELQTKLAEQINTEEQLARLETERLAIQRDNALEALKIAELELVARAKQVGQLEEIAKIETDFAQLRALTAERYEKEITKVTEEEAKKQLDALDKASEEYLNKQKEIRDKRIEFITNEQQLLELRLENQRKSGDNELSIEQFKEAGKLVILKKSLEKQRQAILDTDTTGLGEDLFDVKKIDLQIDDIDNKLGRLEALPILERIKNRFKNLFNLSDEDLKEIGNQISGITNNIFDGLSALNDAELIQQQRIIDARQENIDKLREQLDEELRLKQNGYANNSTALQEQLDLQTEQLKKEEEKRLALEKKASQLRLKQNALEIASNIALSVAKAIEANAKFGLVGVVTAAAQVASIFALIAKAKAQAAQFSQVEKLRTGKRLEGRTHEAGGVPLYVNDADGGRMYEAEKDEWLIGTKPSKEHDNFLERLNGNEFAGVDLNRHIDFSRDFFNDPSGMINVLAPKYDVPIMPDYVSAILPTIRKTVMDGHAAKLAHEKSAMVEAMGGYLQKVETGIGRVEKAIAEMPQIIPLTEMGYMEKRKKGNTTSIAVYDPPKRK